LYSTLDFSAQYIIVTEGRKEKHPAASNTPTMDHLYGPPVEVKTDEGCMLLMARTAELKLLVNDKINRKQGT
jgi:hypothetical protein